MKKYMKQGFALTIMLGVLCVFNTSAHALYFYGTVVDANTSRKLKDVKVYITNQLKWAEACTLTKYSPRGYWEVSMMPVSWKFYIVYSKTGYINKTVSTWFQGNQGTVRLKPVNCGGCSGWECADCFNKLVSDCNGEYHVGNEGDRCYANGTCRDLKIGNTNLKCVNIGGGDCFCERQTCILDPNGNCGPGG